MTAASIVNNYKVGRGEVYFAQFGAGTQVPGGERFFGDCNALAATIKATQLDHYQSTGGVKTIDQSATIQSDSSGALTTENISNENLALFFFGSSETITTTAVTVTDEVVGPVIPGLYYQVGMTAADPVGARGLDSTTAVTVKDSTGTTTYVSGTDYTFDYVLGRLYVIPGGSIVSGSSIKATYKTAAASRPRVISGQTPIEGALRFISANTVGDDKDMYIPWVKMTPNGSYELISDKYAALQFDLKILRKSGLPSVYFDGRPSAA
jgi:hypothetical protein